MKMKFRNTLSPSSEHRSRESGSALITAVIFAFVIAILSGTYLKLASAEYRASMRSTAYASCLNLAESGVEMGVFALNSGATSGSSKSAVNVPDFLSGSSFSGDVRYVILPKTSTAPVTIYAEGYMHNEVMSTISKQVRVELSSGFQPFAKGFAAKNGITFSGLGVFLDSFNSNYGPYDSVLPYTYIDADGNQQDVPEDYGTGGKNKNDDLYVAGDTVSNGNATVYGYISVPEEERATIGPNGSVSSYDQFGHDPSRVSGDFYADFPVETDPTNTTTYVTEEVTGRDRVGNSWVDVIGDVDVTSISGDITISDDDGSPAIYAMSEISGGMITIDGDVTLVMSGGISLSGQSGSGIIVPEGSSLTIYTAHGVAIAGQGVANTGVGVDADGNATVGNATDFSIIGTAVMDGDSAGQDIKIAGNGSLAASVYAPNADVTLNGGGNSGVVYGGVVALNGTITGGQSFHFDEALRESDKDDGTYSVDSWLEMTGGPGDKNEPLDLTSHFAN